MLHPTAYLKFVQGKLYQLWVSDDRSQEEWRVVRSE